MSSKERGTPTSDGRILPVLAATLALVVFAFAASAQLVRVPYTLVSLSPPPGFTPTRAFGGFENRRAGWMIRVQDFDPAEYPRLAAAFSSLERANALFGSDGVHITSIEQLALESGDVRLAIGVQESIGPDLIKYMALMGARGVDRRPVVIMFNLSRSSVLGRSDVETVLRSVKVDDPPTLAEKVPQLLFGFREVPPFRTVEVGPDAEPQWARLAAFDAVDSPEKRLTIVIRRFPTVTRPEETAGMNATLIRTSFSREATILEQRAEAFADGPGDFIMASADGRTAFYFLRVLPDRTYVWFTAVGESRAIEDARDAVMDIASSVELRE